jgi:CO/xanthine dehydrogenase Mo-binding subunit
MSVWGFGLRGATAYVRDWPGGTVEIALNLQEHNQGVAATMSAGQARELGRALLAAADESERIHGRYS